MNSLLYCLTCLVSILKRFGFSVVSGNRPLDADSGFTMCWPKLSRSAWRWASGIEAQEVTTSCFLSRIFSRREKTDWDFPSFADSRSPGSMTITHSINTAITPLRPISTGIQIDGELRNESSMLSMTSTVRVIALDWLDKHTNNSKAFGGNSSWNWPMGAGYEHCWETL